jgi:hypothetical protein
MPLAGTRAALLSMLADVRYTSLSNVFIRPALERKHQPTLRKSLRVLQEQAGLPLLSAGRYPAFEQVHKG